MVWYFLYYFYFVVSLLVVLKGLNFGCSNFVSFQVGMLMIFDSAPESMKKSISMSGISNFLHFGFSKRSGIVQIFFFL